MTTTITLAHAHAHEASGWSLTVNGEVWFSGLTFREADRRRHSLEWWAHLVEVVSIYEGVLERSQVED